MKDLLVKISNLKDEIGNLTRERNALNSKIKTKQERLTTLEKLTINQLDMFDKELD